MQPSSSARVLATNSAAILALSASRPSLTVMWKKIVSISFSIATFVLVWGRRQHCAVATESVAVALRFVRRQDNGERAAAQEANAAVSQWHYTSPLRRNTNRSSTCAFGSHRPLSVCCLTRKTSPRRVSRRTGVSWVDARSANIGTFSCRLRLSRIRYNATVFADGG